MYDGNRKSEGSTLNDVLTIAALGESNPLMHLAHIIKVQIWISESQSLNHCRYSPNKATVPNALPLIKFIL